MHLLRLTFLIKLLFQNLADPKGPLSTSLAKMTSSSPTPALRMLWKEKGQHVL